MPARLPPPCVSAWPSHAYWRESEPRIKQYWYVSFCLMMSSVQDRLTGLTLQASGNLNWATTAFYYSAVHAGRLVCFVCTGDYPTKHKQLAELLAPHRERDVQPPPRQFHFDWLDTFRRYLRTNPQPAARAPAEQSRADRDAILTAIDTALPCVRASFDQFAPLLAKFKNLRNDCNYEALLVAHEVNHFLVTKDFDNLVRHAEMASKIAVELAAATYLAHVQQGSCFEALRRDFHAAHSHYMEHRFGWSLQQKFGGVSAARTELKRVTTLLGWPGAPATNNVDHFLQPIMYDTFGEKQGLMRRWHDDIEALSGALPQPR